MSSDIDHPRFERIRRAYRFLCNCEKNEQLFTLDDLVEAAGWTKKTTRMYLSKKLGRYVSSQSGFYQCAGLSDISEGAFCRSFSQKAEVSENPDRPQLPDEVESLITKARDAALTAVQNYNNPLCAFRTGTFLVLMIIAYTSLFHAIFERDGVDYIARDKNGSAKKVGNSLMLWDLRRCIKRYWEGQTTAVTKNLELIYEIRHMVEHRSMPAIDAMLAGHCQALLMNFEELLVKEFSGYFSLNTSLAIALQISGKRSPEAVRAMRRYQGAEFNEVRQFVDFFHEQLSPEILNDSRFVFRVWLVPKTANRISASDVSLEFVPISDGDELRKLEKSIVAIKSASHLVDPSQLCNLWESEVLVELRERLGEYIDCWGTSRRITGPVLRAVISAHRIESPSEMMYRPEKPGSRAMYGIKLIQWIEAEYGKDRGFFAKALGIEKPEPQSLETPNDDDLKS